MVSEAPDHTKYYYFWRVLHENFFLSFTKSAKGKGSAKRQTEYENNIPTKVRKLLDWAGKSLKSLSEKLNSHETVESSAENSTKSSSEISAERSTENLEEKSFAMDSTQQTGNGHCLIYIYLLDFHSSALLALFCIDFSHFWLHFQEHS